MLAGGPALFLIGEVLFRVRRSRTAVLTGLAAWEYEADHLMSKVLPAGDAEVG
jgi:hypothetical protein